MENSVEIISLLNEILEYSRITSSFIQIIFYGFFLFLLIYFGYWFFSRFF